MGSLFAWPGMESLAEGILSILNCQEGTFEWRHFPDGESYIRLISMPNKKVLILCSLDHPDTKLIPLFFLVDTLRDYGAQKVGLVAPYLCYLRQDIRFKKGEALTSRTCAAILSQYVDWLITVDPHLHRYHQLNEIYTIPTKVVHASSAIASWIQKNVPNPLIIGPDSESAQFIMPVAKLLDVPFITMKKTRLGDRQVMIKAPDNLSSYLTYTPVLVDDVISSGQTLIQAAKILHQSGLKKSIAIAVHALCEKDIIEDSDIERLVTCNTVLHPTNEIDLSADIAHAIKELL